MLVFVTQAMYTCVLRQVRWGCSIQDELLIISAAYGCSAWLVVLGSSFRIRKHLV
jgi:hypothetical protein